MTEHQQRAAGAGERAADRRALGDVGGPAAPGLRDEPDALARAARGGRQRQRRGRARQRDRHRGGRAGHDGAAAVARREPHRGREHRQLDRRPRPEEPQLAVPETLRPLQLGRAEVGSRLRRHDRIALLRPQEQHRRLRDDQRGDQRGRQAELLRHRIDATPCRSPSSPTSTATATPSRRCSRLPSKPARGDLVPGRPRRLRRRARRLRRARRSHADLPGRQPRPRRRRRALARRVLARRRARRALDAGGHLGADARVPAQPRARRVGRRATGSSTPPRAIRSGSTCSRPCWPSCASTPRTPRLRSSATPTWRSPSTAPRASRRPARRGAKARRSTSRGRVAPQPGRRRPAARRRPACGLAAARHAAPDRELPARGVRHRRRRGRDPRRAPAGLARRAPAVRAVSQCGRPRARPPSGRHGPCNRRVLRRTSGWMR